MRVLVQWTQRTPRDWAKVDSANWPTLPDRGIPPLGVLGGADNSPGWVHRLNCQGVSFVGDHYAVEDIPGGCRVTSWWDDPDSYPDGRWYAQVWTFLDLAVDADGIMNTRQSQVVYAQSGAMAVFATAFHVPVEDLDTAVQNCTFRPWEEFARPPVARHGVWVPDALDERHGRARSAPSFRDWIVR